MDYLSNVKELVATSDSFCPLREREVNTNGVTYFTQITELMSTLAQKRSQLRELKIQNQMFQGKQQQQAARMTEITAEFQLTVEKQDIENEQYDRNQESIQILEEDINILIQDISKLKDLCALKYNDIINVKKQRELLTKEHRILETSINEFHLKNANIQKQNVQLENIINLNNTQILKVKEGIKNHQIRQNQLQSETQTNLRKVVIGHKQITAEQYKKKQINEAIKSAIDKINNCTVEIKDRNFQCSQIEFQNNDVENINNRLKADLAGVKDHLQSLKKVNRFLSQKLQNYSRTAQRVLKVVGENEARRQNK